jgi:adenylate cyclase class 2
MIEVEVKAHAQDLEAIETNLRGIGAHWVKEEYQEDLYFNAPHRDFAVTDEALRVRRVSDEKGDHNFVTYKGAKLDSVSKTRKEIEVGIKDPVKMEDIFENIGFRPAAPVKKHRIIYCLDDVIITLDRVQNVGNFLEIEIDIEEGEDYQDALDKIYKIYGRLGIEDGFERRSYLEIMGVH